MVRPITWRNVNAPSANPASALGIAVGAFRGAQQGSIQFADQMGELIEREDEQLTNEAVADALRTGTIDPTLDRRVDRGTLLDAISTQENIETANLEQEGLGYTNKINAYKSSDNFLKRQDELADLEIKIEQSKAKNETTRLEMLSKEYERKVAEGKKADQREANILEVGSRYNRMVTEYQQRLNQTMPGHIQKFKLDNPDATEVELETLVRNIENNNFAKAEEYAQDDYRRLRGEWSQELDLTGADLNFSDPEQTYDAVQGEQLRRTNIADAATEATNKNRQDNFSTINAGDKGDRSNLYLLEKDGDSWVPRGNKGTANRLNSNDLQTYVQRNWGYSLDSDDAKEAKQVLSNVGGNTEAFHDVMDGQYQRDTGFFSSAGFDWKNAKATSNTLGGVMRTAAEEYTPPTNTSLTAYDPRIEKNTSGGTPAVSEEEAANNSEEAVAGETDLQTQVKEILGKDTILEIDESRSDSDPAVQRLRTILLELETQKKNGDRIPLSTQQLKDRREALRENLRIIAQPKAPVTSALQSALQNNPIQPK